MSKIIILTGTFVISFMGSCLNPAVPAISQDLGNGSVEVVWIITAYMLASAALPVPDSGLAGRISNESVLTSGLGLFALASTGADAFLQIMESTRFLWSGLCILGFFMALKKKM